MPAKKRLHPVLRITFLVATILSRVFDPAVVILVLVVIALARANVVTTLSTRQLLIVLSFFYGIPFFYLMWSLRTHQISNWDITNRKERVKPLLALLLFLVVDFFVSMFLGEPMIASMIILLFLWTFGFFLITLVWKISGHTGIASLFCALMVSWFGSSFLPVWIIIPFVAWARIVRRDHTLAQVSAGVIYSLVIVEIWSQYFANPLKYL